jgi:ABC-type antimicrobial peptide transport system permease subunit
LLLGIAATRLLAMVVYQASALDPAVLIGVLATMAVVGAASAALPAKRALAVNPAKLLREE